jgi:two-component system response regulator YesN
VHITVEEQDAIPGLRERVNYLLDIIEEEKCTEHGENNYFQQSVVSALYCLLTRHFPGENQTDLTKDQKEFLGILEYIGEHFDENINVSILAERLFMYRGTISSLFAKHAGMSLNDYIYSLRIKKANDLMRQGSSITEAALSSGFQSVRTFNNTYKKITGITPTEYRKKKMEKK